MYFLTHRHVLLCVTACAKNKFCSSFSSSDKFLKLDMINSKIPIEGKAKCFFNNNSLLHAPSKIRLSVWVSLFRSWINLRIKLFLKTRKSAALKTPLFPHMCFMSGGYMRYKKNLTCCIKEVPRICLLPDSSGLK